MPLDEQLSAEQFAQVPEPVRDYYRQDGDRYVLDVVPRRVSNTALDTKRKAESEAQRIAKTYEGLDPEEARAALELKRSLETQELVKKGDIETLLERERKKLRGEADKIKGDYEARLSSTNAVLAKLLRDDAVTRAAVDAGVRKEALDDVLLHAGTALSVVDGKVVDREGEAVDVSKWLKGLLDKKRHWLGDSTGGGTQKGGGGGGAPQNMSRSKMTHEQKAEYQKKHGLEAYFKLPA